MLENLVLGALFFVLVPGILVSLPRGGSKVTVALVHAVVFVLAYMVLQYLAGYGGYGYMVYDGEEGFKSGATGSYNIKDMGGRMCPFPYDCVRGTGWFNGLSICKCKGGDIPSGSTAIFKDSSVDVRKLEYK
jgi:hypothetical protein